MSGIEIVLSLLAAYLIVGLLFSFFFVTCGVGRIDANARGVSVGFRLLILPGCAALWPIMLMKWMRAREEG